MSFSYWVLIFTLCSILGWAVESLWCWAGTGKPVNRGFLRGPWCPIYGFGAVILLVVGGPFKAYPLLVFLVALVFTTLLEYFTGWLMETLFKTRWWDYSNRRFQIKGRVCLRNSLLFGLLGVALVYLIEPTAWELIVRIPAQRVVASVLVAVLFFDFVRSLSATANLEAHLHTLRTTLCALEDFQQSSKWYIPTDLHGSLIRLRNLCAAQPDNPAAADILARLDMLMRRERESIRLLRAFPRFAHNRFASEVQAMRDAWVAYRIQRRARRRTGIRALLHREWEAARLSYRGVTVTRMIWVFFIACIIGYIVETLFCLVTNGYIESRQGMIYGPFSQVYGFGGVFMVLLLTPFAAKGDAWLFFGSALVGGLFEALISYLQELLFSTRSWDYSYLPFSFFGGRTSLLYMFFWGILGIAYMRLVYPRMAVLIDRIQKRPKHTFTWLIAILLGADMLLSSVAVVRWAERVAGLPPEHALAQWLDRRYPDDMLEEIYPNMIFTDDLPEDVPSGGK